MPPDYVPKVAMENPTPDEWDQIRQDWQVSLQAARNNLEITKNPVDEAAMISSDSEGASGEDKQSQDEEEQEAAAQAEVCSFMSSSLEFAPLVLCSVTSGRAYPAQAP